MNKYLKYISFLNLIFTINCSISFQTLREAKEYINQTYTIDIIEGEPQAAIREMNPLFIKFYKDSLTPFYKKIGYKLKLLKQPLWTVTDFRDLLQQTVINREINGFTENYTLSLSIKNKSKCLIVSNIRASVRSLIRMLDWLEKTKIINNDLIFLDPNTFFIFDGNAIDGDPFNLETLYLIMLLMNKNPNNVFYVKGKEENNNQWHNHNLKQELLIRARYLAPYSLLPLGNLVSRFFKTLPAAIYITGDNPELERITIKSLPDSEISKKQWQVCIFKKKQADKPTPHIAQSMSIRKGSLIQQTAYDELENCVPSLECLSSHTSKPRNKHLREVIISPDDRLVSYKYSSGLTLIQPNLWLLVSSPTIVYKKNFDFYYDAVVSLTLYTDLTESLISVYNTDPLTPEFFVYKATYNVFTGQIKYNLERAIKSAIHDFKYDEINKAFEVKKLTKKETTNDYQK